MAKRFLWRAAPVVALLVFIPLMISLLPSDTPPDPAAQLRERLADNLRRGRPVQALYQIEALAALDGWTTELLRAAGEMTYTLGDHRRAAAYWAAIPVSDIPQSVRRQVAAIAVELQDWTALVPALERLLAAAPDDAWAHYQLGWLLAVTNPAAALPHLQAAARAPAYRDTALELLSLIQTADAHLPIQIGLLLAERGQWPQAEYAFKQAAATDGPLAEALAYTAVARDQQGKDGSAAIQRALDLAPDNALVHFLDGLHQRLTGNLTASLKAFQLAAALNPVNPAYAAELGTAYWLADNLIEAEVWYQRAVTLSGADSRFQQMLDDFRARVLP